MDQILTVVTPTFFTIALGYLFGRVKRSSPVLLVDAAMYIAVPCLVFTSILSSQIVIREAVKIWISSLVIMAGTFLVARLVFALGRTKHSALYLPIVFMNLVNIPFPIIYMAFGTEGLANAALFYIPGGLLVYTVGVYVAAGKKGTRNGLREALRVPLVYAALLGLFLNLAGMELPELMMDSLRFVGQASIPLLLLILGMNISRIRPSHLPLTATASVLRIGVGFGFGLLAAWSLGLTGIPRSVVLLDAAMPSAIFTALVATKYDNEAELVSSVVLATTVASIVVIPALLYYLT